MTRHSAIWRQGPRRFQQISKFIRWRTQSPEGSKRRSIPIRRISKQANPPCDRSIVSLSPHAFDNRDVATIQLLSSLMVAAISRLSSIQPLSQRQSA